MGPELEERLKGIEAKLNDTYRIVSKIRRVQRNTNTVRGVYWLFIILLAFGAFYYIQPYVGQLKNIYNFSTSGNLDTFNTFFDQFSGTEDN